MNYRKPLAFLKRDFHIALSYRFSFLLQLISVFFFIMSFYFISKLFGKAALPYLSSYGGDYFPFVLIGLAMANFLNIGLTTFAESIREEQTMGTLEAMLVTPSKLSTIILSSSLWNFLFSSAKVSIYLLLGGLLFGVDFSRTNLPAALLILALTTLSFCSLGIISASFIMVFKRGTPITHLLTSSSNLFGGVFFPIAVLPGWLQNISKLLPITYSLQAMRHAVLNGYSLRTLSHDLLALVAFAGVTLPLSIFIFNIAVKKAKERGSLAHY